MATGTLTGQTIANTYKSLLKITGTTSGGETLHATTQRVIEDGDGNPFPYSAAQDALLMTSTNRLEFGTNANYVYQVGSNVLGLVAGSEIDLTATAIDINGTADVSGTLTVGGVLTVNAGAVFNEASASVDFRVESNGNANALFVDGSANNIGIGTSSPDAASSLYIQGNGTGNSTNAWIYIDGAQDSGLKILDGGTMRWMMFNSTSDADKLFIRDEENDTGVYIAQDAQVWTGTSDISLKTDISSIADALSKVNSIRGVNFKWKKYRPDGSKPIPSRDRNRIGCIAQEVNEILPEAVDTSKDGEWGVSYSTLIPLLVEAVKELSVSNDALKARIEVLEAA